MTTGALKPVWGALAEDFSHEKSMTIFAEEFSIKVHFSLLHTRKALKVVV